MIEQLRKEYDANNVKKDGKLLKFSGVKGKDVYNCSIPFVYGDSTYILGRVEPRKKFADSVSYLFRQNKNGVWQKVHGFDALPIEDPCYIRLDNEVVVIGTHVVKECGRIKTYYGYFYRGKDVFHLEYFTTGPYYMKDIRLVQLPRGEIGVFSRPRSDEIKKKYGSESVVGFTVIKSLDELSASVIEKAEVIVGFFSSEEWGGVNQAFWLGNGLIGLIGHQCYNRGQVGADGVTYLNTAYIFDMKANTVIDMKIIATRDDYPETESKLPGLKDCAFTSGITDFPKESVELYSGLSDVAEGVVTIENPFLKYVG